MTDPRRPDNLDDPADQSRLDPYDRPYANEGQSDPVVSDDATELEMLLRALPMMAPSADLDRRVEGAIRECAGRGFSARDWRVALLATAAGIALTASASIFVPRGGNSPVSTIDPKPVISAAATSGDTGVPDVEPALQRMGAEIPVVELPEDTDASAEAKAELVLERGPIEVQRTFERIEDEGIVLIKDGTAYQRLRRHSVRRIVVVDPVTGDQVVVTIPTQEIVVKRLEPF